ncbi:metal-dependent phosphohydrolase [Micromonospora sp. 4G57]|uniref:Metal-dependent phosphohydrolase n=1 Tax=Micromonospora sicca TaxID=2202420 RepID=A0ABU5JL16_9ACTN|nr:MULTISPECIES: metal-dependent phosphohydrolase [unclassified Micromonospora]MDZ5447069.1 metal-dependent phosphohydrolase [Micromonospora sp. 4G57]MDZ5493054.1 metal-dependent phosphohydrolase [Micromonospora sp. 4G53]
MTVLSHPRPRLVNQALRDAQRWCAGHTIDDQPALAHAVRVAVTIGEHIPAPAPDLIAAALLHDVPDFVPSHEELYRTLTEAYGPEVPRIIAALQAEHQALDQPNPPVVVGDLAVVLASTADKIVALTSLLRRARASGHVTEFFSRRSRLVALLPYFREYSQAARAHTPVGMSAALDVVLNLLDQVESNLPPRVAR